MTFFYQKIATVKDKKWQGNGKGGVTISRRPLTPPPNREREEAWGKRTLHSREGPESSKGGCRVSGKAGSTPQARRARWDSRHPGENRTSPGNSRLSLCSKQETRDVRNPGGKFPQELGQNFLSQPTQHHVCEFIHFSLLDLSLPLDGSFSGKVQVEGPSHPLRPSFPISPLPFGRLSLLPGLPRRQSQTLPRPPQEWAGPGRGAQKWAGPLLPTRCRQDAADVRGHPARLPESESDCPPCPGLSSF